MRQRFLSGIRICLSVFPSLLLIAVAGGAPPPAAPSPGVEPAPVSPVATPMAEEVVLRLESEKGPASIKIRLKGGTQPGTPWRPVWPGLPAPIQAGRAKGEYTAPVAVDYALLKRWNHPQPAGERFYWPGRFADPVPYSIVTLPSPPVWPLELRYDAGHRPLQLPYTHDINAGKSLLVTDLSVVNDPKRTWEPSQPDAGNREGVWTFHHLMTAIANERVTGVAAGEVARNWMESFTVPQKPDGPQGGVAAARNAKLIQTALSCWPKLPKSNVLDTSRSPFRLLAIVNRLDLRIPTAWNHTNIRRAELRFVFSYVEQTGQPEPGMQRDFLVILEFGVPLPTFTDVRNYALRWAGLSRPGLTSADYCAELAALTEDIVHASAAPERPNGSNLNHLRTEDMYFAQAYQPWDMREFLLDGNSHLLKLNPLDMTPDSSWATAPDAVSCSMTMRQWIQGNESVIRGGVYELPWQLNVPSGKGVATRRLRGAVALDGFQNWFALPIQPACDAWTRLAFIRNTCNGCHSSGTWTPENEATWAFKFIRHINGRPAGQAATTSAFLGRDLARRRELLQSIVESDPWLPLAEFFQPQVTTVE